MSAEAQRWLGGAALVAGYFAFFWWAISPPALPTAWIFGFLAVTGPALGYFLFGDAPPPPGGR